MGGVADRQIDLVALVREGLQKEDDQIEHPLDRDQILDEIKGVLYLVFRKKMTRSSTPLISSRI